MKSISNSYIKSFIPLAAVAAVIVLFYLAAIAPEQSKIGAMKNELSALSSQTLKAQDIVLSTPEIVREIEILKKREHALALRIPEGASIPKIVSRITAELERPGIRVVSIVPEKSGATDETGSVLIKINFNADFKSLGELLKGIEESEMLFSVYDFLIRPSPHGGELEVRMGLQSFFRE